MPSNNYHYEPHTGLPRHWLGQGELGHRKAHLQRDLERYFHKNTPDFKMRHPELNRRSWPLHLNVVRKKTKWFDWRIFKGEKRAAILPSMVHPEQIPSVLHFLYFGDYSVDRYDLDKYNVPKSPDGCVTCTQLCKLLRYHLSMFRTGLILGIVGLQGLAFFKFRALLDCSPLWVLQFAVRLVYSRPPIPDGANDYHVSAIKGLKDYRPELVLPAVLRYCGYFRINPQYARGEEEFHKLRRISRTFNMHLTFGLWLDTVHIQVPLLKFPGSSDGMICIHPYLTTPLPKMTVDRKRSNYQYVTYLQPLPFERFSEQRPTNVPARVSAPTNYSVITQQARQYAAQNRAPVNPAPHVTVQQQYQPEQSNPSQVFDASVLLDEIFDFDMDVTEPLPQIDPTVPVATNTSDVSFDSMQMDFSGVDFEDLNLDQALNDQYVSPEDSADFDWTQPVNWDAAPVADESFMDLLNNDAMDVDMDIDMENSMPDQPYPPLPDIDFSGLGFLHPSARAPEEIAPRNCLGFNAFDHMLNDYSMQSATINAPFDWSKATGSAVEPIDLTVPEKTEELTVKSRASSRYNLRSRSSIPTTVSESIVNKYVPSTSSSSQTSSKASVASTQTSSSRARPRSRQSAVTPVRRPVTRATSAATKDGSESAPRYHLRTRPSVAGRT